MLRIVPLAMLGLLLLSCIQVFANDAATVAEARSAIDLTTFPTFQKEGEATLRIAMQRYQAKGNVKAITNEIQRELAERGWKSSGGGVVSDAYASDLLINQGFSLSLMVMPGPQPDLVSVNLINLGNVELEKLPRLDAASGLINTPNNLIYYVAFDVETARQKCREKFEAAGWSWFGDTSVSFFMRQNAVRLQVMVVPAPNQEGKSMIQYSAEQLSTMIPIPAGLSSLQYADTTGGMIMDSPLNIDEFCSAFANAMKEGNWQATTEQPVQNGKQLVWIFRSSEGELVESQIFEFEGMTRCRTSYMTAKELEAESEKVRNLQNRGKSAG